MRPVSDAFLRTLRGSHTAVFEARICAPGQTGVDPTGTTIPILGGDVRLDGTADVRSTLDMTTEGRGMWPRTAADLLAPYGNEVFARRGIDYGTGVEWVSLGYFRLYTPEQDDAPDGPIRLAGKDRMSGLVDGRLLTPLHVPSTSTYGGVTTQLVQQVYPGAVIEWDDTTVRDTAIGRALIAEQDRYVFLRDLWDSVGKIGHWDHRGVLVIADPPDPTTPVWDINHGHDGVLISMSRQVTREGVYNGVVAEGEAADTQAPPRAVVVDLEANSPTFWYGAFGQVPTFYTSPFITTAAQATTAAAAKLRKVIGLPYNVDFGAIPNPALEPDDPVRVRYSDRDAPEIHILQDLTIPLTVDAAMTASTREQTRVLIGAP